MSNVACRLTIALADRYKLDRQLGAGGMATVYLAEDVKHHRQVAIKLLKPDPLSLVINVESTPLPLSRRVECHDG